MMLCLSAAAFQAGLSARAWLIMLAMSPVAMTMRFLDWNCCSVSCRMQ